MNGFCKVIICAFLPLLLSLHVSGQRKLDTLRLDSIRIFPKSKMINRLLQRGIDAITRDNPDTANQSVAMNMNSENPYRKYNGKIIRHIIIRHLGFEQTVTDTSARLQAFGTRLMNKLHTDTKEWVIRDNLFIKEGAPLNAYMMADNERYLRTLDFIQDARLVVKPVIHEGDSMITDFDSVDIEVFSRDFFTLTGGLDIGSIQHAKAEIAETNLAGMGQKLQFTALLHQDREPRFGYSVLYRKNSVLGSFVNATGGYSVIGHNLYDGKEEEQSYFIGLDRPLISPYSRIAGALFYANRKTDKLYHINRPDSVFYKYRLNTYDAWVGYNITGERSLKTVENRDRKFLSVRYMENAFHELPYQVSNGFNPVFNDVTAILGQVTFFRQDFFKTNYIYGFGATEDVPQGYNISIIGGWVKQVTLERPYAGIKIDRYIVSRYMDFIRFFLRTGAYYNLMELEDAGIVAGANVFTRLWYLKKLKVRQYTTLSYTGIFNRKASELLAINNPFGLQNFSHSHITGDQRLNLFSETYLYLNYKLLGFRFAPFITGNVVMLTPEKNHFEKADIYTGVGGGIRTRNENLVFGTIELRGIYFPRQVQGHPSYKIMLNSDLRYRYRSSFVYAPDFFRPNIDDGL